MARTDGSRRWQLEKHQGCPYAIIELAKQKRAECGPDKTISLEELYEAIYGGVIPPHMRREDRNKIYRRLRGFIKNAKTLSINNAHLPMLRTITKRNRVVGFRLATHDEREHEAIRNAAAKDRSRAAAFEERAHNQEEFTVV